MLAISFVVGLSSHLIAEMLRRFVHYSNSIYIIADLIFIATTVYVASTGSFRFDRFIGALLFTYATWGVASLVYSQENPELLLVGLRPIALSLSAYVISENFFRQHKQSLFIFVNMLGMWTAIILFVAILQLILGYDAPINQLPTNDEFGGRGDYVGAGNVLVWLFRPTSIFMHTGRLGQYAFYLASTLCFYFFLSKKKSFVLHIYLFMAIVLIIVSGQRAAGVFLSLSCLYVVFTYVSCKQVVRFIIMGLALMLPFFLISNDLRNIVLLRFYSGFTDSVERIYEMTRFWDVGVAMFPLFGKGLGFFSFGGQAFGGAIYYVYMTRYGGGGENAWLRIQGETGLPGVLLFIMMMLYVAVKSYRRVAAASEQYRYIHLTSLCFVASTCVWAFTHDLFGNYLHMIGIFTLFGASSGLADSEYQPRLRQ